jgi:hypothetical protein
LARLTWKITSIINNGCFLTVAYFLGAFYRYLNGELNGELP